MKLYVVEEGKEPRVETFRYGFWKYKNYCGLLEKTIPIVGKGKEFKIKMINDSFALVRTKTIDDDSRCIVIVLTSCDSRTKNAKILQQDVPRRRHFSKGFIAIVEPGGCICIDTDALDRDKYTYSWNEGKWTLVTITKTLIQADRVKEAFKRGEGDFL